MFVSILESNYNVAREAAVTYQLPAAGHVSVRGLSARAASVSLSQVRVRQVAGHGAMLTNPWTYSSKFSTLWELRLVSLDIEREGRS